VQPTCPPVNANLMELLITIDACKRASARSITAVIPYFGYARADRKVMGREAITAKLAANLITEAGADRVLAMDLHSGQCVGYFDIPVDHVYGEAVILDYLASKRIPTQVCPHSCEFTLFTLPHFMLSIVVCVCVCTERGGHPRLPRIEAHPDAGVNGHPHFSCVNFTLLTLHRRTTTTRLTYPPTHPPAGPRRGVP
jgi:hypothetical protein